jgi:hypothetical protein
MGEEVLVSKLSGNLTGSLLSLSYLLKMTLFCWPFKILFVKPMFPFPTCIMSDTQVFVTPVEFFIFFPFFTVVTLFHRFLQAVLKL